MFEGFQKGPQSSQSPLVIPFISHNLIVNIMRLRNIMGQCATLMSMNQDIMGHLSYTIAVGNLNETNIPPIERIGLKIYSEELMSIFVHINYV